MLKWMRLYNKANPQIKYFALNWFVYGIVIVITTIYCYGRLNYVRSYPTPKDPETKQVQVNIPETANPSTK